MTKKETHFGLNYSRHNKKS